MRSHNDIAAMFFCRLAKRTTKDSLIIRPEGPIGEVPVQMKGLSPAVLQKPSRHQEIRDNRYSIRLSRWI
jgi:hypothetical protein